MSARMAPSFNRAVLLMFFNSVWCETQPTQSVSELTVLAQALDYVNLKPRACGIKSLLNV